MRRVLVAGAAGFLGRAVVRALAAQGLEPVGLVRRASQQRTVEAAGGVAFVGDVLDRSTLLPALSGCQAVIHLASGEGSPEGSPAFARSVRVEGTGNLLRAAHDAGAGRFVLGSGYWVYAGSPGPITEESPLEPAGESRNNFDAERAVLKAREDPGLRVGVVRPGMVYGDGAWLRPILDSISDGSYRIIEGGTNAWSFVSLEDTARAFAAVVRLGKDGEIYNVADGEPRPWGEFAAWVAGRIGCPAPPSIDRATAEATIDPVVVRHLMANRAMTGAKLRGLGWRPQYRTYQDGLADLLPTLRASPHRSDPQ